MSKVTAVPLRPVSRAGVIALWIGIVLFVAGALYAAWLTSYSAVMTAMPSGEFLLRNGDRSGVKTTPSGLEYQVIEAGKSGPTPSAADVVQIDYRGTLTNGVLFDASKKGEPLTAAVSGLIPGFAEALTLMPRGSRYRVWIPPELGYGDRQNGQIPPNSVLVFDITLHDFGPAPRPDQLPVQTPTEQPVLPDELNPQVPEMPGM